MRREYATTTKIAPKKIRNLCLTNGASNVWKIQIKHKIKMSLSVALKWMWLIVMTGCRPRKSRKYSSEFSFRMKIWRNIFIQASTRSVCQKSDLLICYQFMSFRIRLKINVQLIECKTINHSLFRSTTKKMWRFRQLKTVCTCDVSNEWKSRERERERTKKTAKENQTSRQN